MLNQSYVTYAIWKMKFVRELQHLQIISNFLVKKTITNLLRFFYCPINMNRMKIYEFEEGT
jgi:hypothetical protein